MKSRVTSALRHILGYGIVVPLLLVAIAVQAMVFGPLLHNRATIPHLMFRLIALTFGIKHRINPASAPFATDRRTLFLANHLSRLDFAGLYRFPDAALMMNAMFFHMPVFGPILRLFAASAGLVGTEQTLAGKSRDLAQLAAAMGEGRDLFIFAEGIQTDGRRLLRYSSGAAEILYDPALLARHPALATAVVQPVIFRVKSIDGEEMLTRPEAWGRYSLSQGRTPIFAGMSRQTRVGQVTLDILICPALDPRDYANAADLVAAVHETARRIVAPGQTMALTRRQWKHRLDLRDFTP